MINDNRFSTFLLAAIAVFITVSMVLFPQDSFEASLNGLHIWWNIVFPALLPFFIIAQLLIGLGVVHLMGIFFEPLMRPVFNVPGIGSFVLAMGLASGFPLGAIITADMRRNKMVSKVEAERLVSTVNTSDPLFMLGAVAVGMFGLPEIGFTLATAHYLSCLSVGLLMRFHGSDPYPTTEPQKQNKNVFIRAFDALIEARKKDGRTLGQLMGDAIEKSISTQLLIGGFIILFSVIIRVLDVVGIVKIFSSFLSLILAPVGLEPALAPSLISGLFEIDLGCQAASMETFIPLEQKMIAVSMIIAWSGLSVHAQVASIVSDTDINIKPYIIARLIHSVLAGFYTYLLAGTAGELLHDISMPVFLYTVPSGTLTYWWERTYFLLQQFSIFLLIIFLLSLLLQLLASKKNPFTASRK